MKKFIIFLIAISLANLFLIYGYFSYKKYENDINNENKSITEFVYKMPPETVTIKVNGLDLSRYGDTVKSLYEKNNIIITTTETVSDADFVFQSTDVNESNQMKYFNKDLFYAISYLVNDKELVLFNKSKVKTMYDEFFLFKFYKSGETKTGYTENSHIKYLTENKIAFSKDDVLKNFISESIVNQKTKVTISYVHIVFFVIFSILVYIPILILTTKYFYESKKDFDNELEDSAFPLFIITGIYILLSPYIL